MQTGLFIGGDWTTGQAGTVIDVTDPHDAMHEYTEAKSIWVNVDAAIPPFYGP